MVKTSFFWLVNIIFTHFWLVNSIYFLLLIGWYKTILTSDWLIQGLSHRNLLGDDMTDCSFIFLYILCTMSIRQNIQKALGFAPSRAASKQVDSYFVKKYEIVFIQILQNSNFFLSRLEACGNQIQTNTNGEQHEEFIKLYHSEQQESLVDSPRNKCK